MVCFRRASESPHIDKDVGIFKMFHAFLAETAYFVVQGCLSMTWILKEIASFGLTDEEVVLAL
jgi:hypothetical protein